MTTLAPERGVIENTEEIAWDELAPPCEAEICKGKPAELACKHRHFEGISCSAEGRVYFLCESCYEFIKKAITLCRECMEPASLYAVQRLK